MGIESIRIEATESGTPIPLDAGTYPAVISSIERAEGSPEYGGEQVKFFLETQVVGDDGEPIILWAWATLKLSTQSKLTRWVTAITGGPPELGKVFEIQNLVGKPCRVQISEDRQDGGSTRKRVTDLFGPLKQAPVEQAPDKGCTECFGPLGTEGYFTATGDPYCAAHGPRAQAGA